MLFKLARSTCNYKDEETQNCIKAILSNDIDQAYKDLLNAYYKSDKKPMQIVTDFDKRTESKIEVTPFKVACG